MTCTCVVRNRPCNTRFMKMADTTLQGPVVTVGTVKFKIKNFALWPHSIFIHVFCVLFTVTDIVPNGRTLLSVRYKLNFSLSTLDFSNFF